MSFVNDDITPVELLEVVFFLDNHLIGCDHNIKCSRAYELLPLPHLRQPTRVIATTAGRHEHKKAQ